MINVLIVEDDPMVAEINKNYVESNHSDFKVVDVVYDGKDALNILVNKSSIDLVIADIFMPELSGVDLLKELRKRNIHVDIIFITASKDPHMLEEVLKYGSVDYLVKPFTYGRFMTALENYKLRCSKITSIKHADVVTQDMIDYVISSAEKSTTDFPKGLNERTFNKICNYLKNEAANEFSIYQISKDIEITTVTIRKYMNYLNKLGYIKTRQEYGDVGRPKVVYSNQMK